MTESKTPTIEPPELPAGTPSGDWEVRLVAVEHTIKVSNRETWVLDDIEALLYRGTGDNTFLVHESVAADLMEISRFVLHPDNPNEGDIPTIRQSLTDHGQYKSITVNRGTYSKRYAPWTVGAGNHTLQSARLEGWSHIGVSIVDVGDDELDRILLVDNHSSELSYTRPEAVLKILERMGVERTSYTPDDMHKLFTAMSPPPGDAGGKEYDEDHAHGVKYLRCPNCEHEFPA